MASNGYDENNEKVKANCAWITKDFLQDVLTRYEKNDNIHVLDYDVRAAVGVGDNYLSILYRTTVKFTRDEGGPVESRQLMIKGAPTAQILKEMLEEIGFFRKELAMYSECLPAMKKMSEKVFPNEDFISPDFYECSLPNTIIMEDLQTSGYKMANRRDQLDYEHCVFALKSLARFHAISFRIAEDDPKLIEKGTYDCYQESSREKMSPFIEKAFQVWTEVLESWENSKQFVPIIRRIMKDFYDKILYMVRPDTGSLSVVNHGDSWINNFLFKYDSDGNVIHTKLIDYQLSRFASPALDLLYFLFTSPKPDIVTESMFDLIQIYHKALTSDMRKLGINCNQYPLEALHEDLREKSLYAVIVLATITPVIVAKPADAMNLDDLKEKMDNDFPMLKNYQDEHYKGIAEKYLKYLDKIGYLKDAEKRLKHVEEFVAKKPTKDVNNIIAISSDVKHLTASQEITGQSS